MNYIQGLKKVLQETTTSYGGIWGGANTPIGSHGGDFQAGDWFATGDARNVYGLETDPKKRAKSKSKTKKKRKKFALYRRTFAEDVDPEPEIVLDCVMFVNEEYQDLVSRVLKRAEISFKQTDCVFEAQGYDEELQDMIFELSDIMTEGRFKENVLCLLGEMNEFDIVSKEDILSDIENGMKIARKMDIDRDVNWSDGKSIGVELQPFQTTSGFKMFACLEREYEYRPPTRWVVIEVPNIRASEEYAEQLRYIGAWVPVPKDKNVVPVFLDYAHWLREYGVSITDCVLIQSTQKPEFEQIADILQSIKMGVSVF